MIKARNIFRPLTSKNICQIYELLHNDGLVSFIITPDAINKIEALVANINGVYFGQESYVTREQKVVAYLYFLIKNHPFTDGNKRTACLSFMTICEMNKVKPIFKNFQLDQLAVFIEQVKEPDHQGVISMLADILFRND